MSELPEGWVIVPLGDMCEVKGGKRLPKGEKFADGVTDYPYIRVSDFSNRSVDLDKLQYLSSNTQQHISNYTISSKDVYVSIAGTIGVVGTIPKELDGANLTENAAKITEITCLEQRFLVYFLSSNVAQQHFDDQTVSTSQPKLALFRIKTLQTPLPPLAEQKRIADKLDALLARVDRCRARLDRVPLILKRFRQAVLAAGTSGQLTADWRKERRIDRTINLVRLEDTGSAFSYGSSAKSSTNGLIPVLRMGNIQNGKLDWKDLVFTSDPIEIAKYELFPGDVLFNRTNSPELVGKTAVYKGERPAIYAGYLIRVKCSSQLLPDYLNYCLNSPEGRDYCWRVKSDGVSQSNINAKKLAAFEFDLPPVEEQHEIVRRVEILFAYADRLAARYQAARAQVERLTPALLAKAFRGELVPQDPADEPAGVLLARLRGGAGRGLTGVIEARGLRGLPLFGDAPRGHRAWSPGQEQLERIAQSDDPATNYPSQNCRCAVACPWPNRALPGEWRAAWSGPPPADALGA